jgi:tricorn protease
VAVDSRGEIFLVPSDAALGEKRQITSSPWRERFQAFSPDGRYLAYISDESHEEEIWLHELASGTKRKVTTHQSTKSEMTWSPNSAKIFFTAANRLFAIDVATGRNTELGFHQAGGYSLDDMSYDGTWLVVTKRDDSQNADIHLFDTRTRTEVNVTRHPGGESNGRLTPDGRHLVFTSNRDAGVNHLFVTSLTRVSEDPNDPLVRERRARSAADSGRAGGGGGGGAGRGGAAGGGGATAPPRTLDQIPVDVEGIDKRPMQLTTGTNGASNVFLSRDGRTIYYTSSDSAGAGLFQIGIDGRDRRKVTTGTFAGLTATPDRRFIFYRGGSGAGGRGGGRGGGAATGSGSEVWRMTMSNQRKERVNFNFTVKVDRRGDWEQVFYESWRVMKYRFYDEKMHGVDWNAALARYAPILRHVGDNEDLYDLANEMIGQLNASHVGVSGPANRTGTRGYTTRYLGFEMEPADGRYKVTHIYHNGPADKEWINLKVGEYVLALDGVELRAGDNYWKNLAELLNDYVNVKIASSPNGTGERIARIRTVTSLTDIKYEEWVEKNREFVDEETGGRIAYVHIRSMNQPSLVRFENEIDQYWDKQGIVVDIRYNGGGNIDQQLIDILERRPYQFWNSRWGSRAWGRRPRQAIAGPKVMLVNHRSGSDSEVTPLGFRDLGLGRIVGTPTSGAVIATGSYSLMNGGSIRTPGSLVVQWDPTKPNNYGINLENYGVAPDVWARNTPADELRGFDRELKAALDEALRMLRQ